MVGDTKKEGDRQNDLGLFGRACRFVSSKIGLYSEWFSVYDRPQLHNPLTTKRIRSFSWLTSTHHPDHSSNPYSNLLRNLDHPMPLRSKRMHLLLDLSVDHRPAQYLALCHCSLQTSPDTLLNHRSLELP